MGFQFVVMFTDSFMDDVAYVRDVESVCSLDIRLAVHHLYEQCRGPTRFNNNKLLIFQSAQLIGISINYYCYIYLSPTLFCM